MKDGFLKVATATPELRVADTVYNAEQIILAIENAAKENTALLVFPELCVTGYTCGDLFGHRMLIDAAMMALEKIAEATEGKNMLTFVGAPIRHQGKIYDCAVVMFDGQFIGVVPKKNLANYGENYEMRWFSVPTQEDVICLGGKWVHFGNKILFGLDVEKPEFAIGCELGEDLWVPESPSTALAKAGATIIVNLSANAEIVGRAAKRRALVSSQSAKLHAAYIYANAGSAESTTDGVFAGHSIIAENGHILSERKPFDEGMQTAVIDVVSLADMRAKKNTYPAVHNGNQRFVEYAWDIVKFQFHETETPRLPKRPFLPTDKNEYAERAETIINIQAHGLKKRIAHSWAKTAVIGISGGLDSTLALLIAARAMDLLGRDRKDIIAVTMPCFGTTVRTKSNAVMLSEALGATVRTVDIKRAVSVHFEDIDHDETNHDVTFENAQARERTQVIMDIANQTSGLVVGTGDLSEVALGWATYNGDHMSMYGVNADVPKTLVRFLVEHFANIMDGDAKKCLLDILDTPVSPELLPAKDGQIAQITEDIVGPYDLHDFFLYYTIRNAYPPKKLFRLAKKAFEGEFDGETILKWQKKFYSRFFTQQFKRSCTPDAPKVGSVALSPRGDWKMPSDAMSTIWMNELNEIEA
ncbi:MAG: NAD(+) synthase [Clostridia bacterium]|nr:NAD(+) synthase [Clostridia bacterium]